MGHSSGLELACESLQGKKESELSAPGFVAGRHNVFEQGMHDGQVNQADRCQRGFAQLQRDSLVVVNHRFREDGGEGFLPVAVVE
ncbi:hypothetical protein [Thiomonas sp. FB-6]|uniref:hypothetical protein n=1 Tax=Thiomonas sp. FB-6 TaxID=1158291 RepID=UPI0012DDC298|nr:hypothetical protein [Thiomonas sp. FB-6]